MRTDLHSTLTNPGLVAIAEWVAAVFIVFGLVIIVCGIWTDLRRRR